MECTGAGDCTLDDFEMVERVNAWRALFSRAISRKVFADRITSVYPSDRDLVTELRGLIAAEADCCPFLKFDLQEQQGRTVVELTFPEEARPLIEYVMP